MSYKQVSYDVSKAPFHVLKSLQFNRNFLEDLCELTDAIRRYNKTRDSLLYLQNLLSDKRAILYFTQPSTRTFLSFQSACQILGLKTSEIRDPFTSSERKGESIEDSLRTFSSYVDLIIMRTPIAGLCDRIAELLNSTPRPVPIINAGSGPDEHPTQALLDIYTIFRSFKNKGGINGKTVMMVGDLKRGRTIKSLSLLLTQYQDVKIIFSSPKEFKIDEDLRIKLKDSYLNFEETEEFESVLSYVDVIYMTRVQDEYDVKEESKEVNYQKYYLKFEHLKHIKKDAIIMHPLPRRSELDVRIDTDPRAKYWRQERNGMWTRAALIAKIFNVENKIVLPKL